MSAFDVINVIIAFFSAMMAYRLVCHWLGLAPSPALVQVNITHNLHHRDEAE